VKKMINNSRLIPFFHPRRVAIVGASEQGMYPAGIIRNLLEHGFKGEIYPVNPRRKQVFGLTCYSDITQVPIPPDLAIVIVPRTAVLPILQQVAQVGTPAAIVITAGFAEADEEGRRLQKEMARLSRETNLAIVGPNCAGVANVPEHFIATRLPISPRTGSVTLLSQSGALMMALYGVFADYHVGINKLLSLGNQVDVTISEALEYSVMDPRTRVIAMFVEGVRNGPRFVQALRAAREAKKPVVLVKSGRTEQGRRAAATHTAALASSGQGFDAVCQQFGAIRVDDVMELVHSVRMFNQIGQNIARGRLAVVTQSGGLGSLTADLADLAGLSLPPLSSQVEKRLRQLPYIASVGVLGNPTDVRGAAVIGSATRKTLAPFMEDPETDVVLLLLAKPAVREEDVTTAQAIIHVAKTYTKPLIVVWVGLRYPPSAPDRPLAHRMLVEAGVPLFEQPGDAIRSLARVVHYYRRYPEESQHNITAHTTFMDSFRHRGARARRDPSHPIPFVKAARILERYNIPLAAYQWAPRPEDVPHAAEVLGFPVALKLISPTLTHKSDAGLVRLGLKTVEEVRKTATYMWAQARGHSVEGFLVQRMVEPGVETLVGVFQDPQFGPMVMLGPGGTLVELINDTVIRLPPLTHQQARAMIEEVRILSRLLHGYRNYPPSNLDALADLLVRVSHLAVAEEIVSLDLNPVIVNAQEAVVVDVRMFF